jgi:hypothetical protein
MKSEARNPNFEIISNDLSSNVSNKRLRGFEFWKFEFVSDFGIRISDLKLKGGETNGTIT